MNREDIRNLALEKINKTKCLILELSTGVGKTKISIDLINHICDRVYKEQQEPTNILILVAKTVHKQTWLDEISKWGGIKSDCITIECYESLKKYKDGYFDIIICDEAQHLSEARLEILDTIHISEALILLSATLKRELREYFKVNYKADVIKYSIATAIENEVLPEPDIYLLPLKLDTTKVIYKSKRYGKDIVTTQQGYYNDISSLIDFYKRKYMSSRNERIKTLWLSKAGDRIKWLSEIKESIVLSLLDKFKNYRTLTFCSSIAQSERLGKYNITSKNKQSTEYLNMFNNMKIKHITACNILNESVNLTDCRIGIFCNLNSSEIITKQRCGRLLRHKKPIIIIPYYMNTREEELVQKMLEEYDKELVKTIININEIIL